MVRWVKFLLGGGALLFVAFYFFAWSIQTAWLGSFPGRDVEKYALWAYSQLACAVLALIFAIVCFVKAKKSYGRTP
jgi:uncharacterized membrane protein